MPAASVAEFIAAYPPQTQTRLRELRAIVRELLPDATEVISYGVPTYRLGPGRGLIYFGAGKRHVALYGTAMDRVGDALAGYDTSKGTVRFPLDRPVPEDLVRKLVSATLAEKRAATQ